MSKIAETWRGLSEAERKHWQDEADCDRRRYDSEMSSYSGPLKVPRVRPRRHPDAPKRAMSAFLHFSRLMKPQIRAQHQDLSNAGACSACVGPAWVVPGRPVVLCM